MIYLDYNASTPIAPSVVAAMAPFLADHYGNPVERPLGGSSCGAGCRSRP